MEWANESIQIQVGLIRRSQVRILLEAHLYGTKMDLLYSAKGIQYHSFRVRNALSLFKQQNAGWPNKLLN